jgi:hypothetical protein
VQIPIACSLSESSARDQLDEWRQLLRDAGHAAVRLSPTELSLPISDRPGQVEAIVRLARREKACCSFFDFRIHVETDGAVLHISVPPEAVAVLDALAAPA